MKFKKGFKTIRNVVFIGIVACMIINRFNENVNSNDEIETSTQQVQAKSLKSNINHGENIDSIINDMKILYQYISNTTGEKLINIEHLGTSSSFEGIDDQCYEFKLDTTLGTKYLYISSDMKYTYSNGEKTKYSDFIDLHLKPFTMELDNICRYITEEINVYGKSNNVSTLTDVRDYIGEISSYKNAEKSVVVDRLYNIINARIDAIETATGTIITESAYDNALNESKEVNYSLDYSPVSKFDEDVNVTLENAKMLIENQFPNMGGEFIELVQDGYMFEVVIEGITYSYLVSKDNPIIYDEYGYEIYSE